MTSTEDFINRHEGIQKDLLQFLHNMIIRHPGITTKISYGLPFYYRKSWICYLNPLKNDDVEFAFTRGNELSNAQGLLDPKGRKQVYSVNFNTLDDIPENTLREIFQEALLLDENVPYSVKKQK